MTFTTRTVTLRTLVAEGCAGTIGELVDELVEKRGVLVDTDTSGRLAVSTKTAKILRAERAEKERLEAAERAETARVAQEASQAADEAARARQAAQEARQVERAALDRRILRLEKHCGPVWELHIEMEKTALREAGGMTVAARDAVVNRTPTLAEAEDWCVANKGYAMAGRAVR